MARRIDSQMNEIIRLRKEGLSYRAIGRRLDIDWRTVKSRLEFTEEQMRQEHWQNVSLQVDVKNLDQHYTMLTRISLDVLNAVRTQPLFAKIEDGPESLLHRLILFDPTKAIEVLADRGIETDELSPDSFTKDRIVTTPDKDRLVQKLLNALYEHEPNLRKAVGEWQHSWSRFQRLRKQYIEEAYGLVAQQDGVKGEATDTVVEELVQNILTSELMGDRSSAMAVKQAANGNIQSEAQNPDNALSMLRETIDPIILSSEAYDTVLSQMTHQARIDPVVEAYSEIVRIVKVIEDSVDEIVLGGRPATLCSLCIPS